MNHCYEATIRGNAGGRICENVVVWESDDPNETVDSVQKEIDSRPGTYVESFGIQGPLTVVDIHPV